MPHPLRLERCGSGATILRSSLLERCGFEHGVSTRRGGTSPAPFDELNLARPESVDDESAFSENRRRFMTACGLGSRALVTVRQVHGALVVDADVLDPLASSIEADALISRDPLRAIGVRTADCVAVLVACPTAGVVAAIHAGWRGIVAGVVDRAIDALRRWTDEPLVAAIGPSISCAAYEVGDDVADAFASRGLSDAVHRAGFERAHVDCHAAVTALLTRAGVAPDAIDGETWCTFADAEHCYSHRRDASQSGRMLAAIGATTPRR